MTDLKNPEMRRRSKWDALPPQEKEELVAAMRAELLRLSDCVEVWLPTTERKTSTMFEVFVDVSRELRNGPRLPLISQETIDEAEGRLKEISELDNKSSI